MNEILFAAIEKTKRHFSNGPHHSEVFECNLGKGRDSLFDLTKQSILAYAENPEFLARLKHTADTQGKEVCISAIHNQHKALILQGLLAMAKK